MTTKHKPNSKFRLGNLVITEAVQDKLSSGVYVAGLKRHMNCDWGDLSPESQEDNFEAIENGFDIFSAYGKRDRRFWIITNGDGSRTTILMPNDYLNATISLSERT